MANIFLDSASLEEIEEILKLGFISGLTTNPSLLKAQSQNEAFFHLKKIVSILNRYEKKIPFSVQVMTNDTSQMITQAHALISGLDYKDLIIKIPCGWNELYVVRKLSESSININCTACITPMQVAIVSNAGAKYVSVFLGKAFDAGEIRETLIQRCMSSLKGSNSKLIVGSLRTTADVELAILGGADIVTIRSELLKQMIQHSKTTEAILLFTKDYQQL